MVKPQERPVPRHSPPNVPARESCMWVRRLEADSCHGLCTQGNLVRRGEGRAGLWTRGQGTQPSRGSARPCCRCRAWPADLLSPPRAGASRATQCDFCTTARSPTQGTGLFTACCLWCSALSPMSLSLWAPSCHPRGWGTEAPSSCSLCFQNQLAWLWIHGVSSSPPALWARDRLPCALLSGVREAFL